MRTLPIFLLFIVASAVPVSAQATEPPRHALDSALAVCQDAQPSTQGMLQCLREAERGWDREMNLWYRELLARVGAAGKPALVKAQKAWMAFRDAEFARLVSLYAMTDGTMYLLFHASDRVDLVRQRALDLRSSCEALRSAVSEEP